MQQRLGSEEIEWRLQIANCKLQGKQRLGGQASGGWWLVGAGERGRNESHFPWQLNMAVSVLDSLVVRFVQFHSPQVLFYSTTRSAALPDLTPSRFVTL